MIDSYKGKELGRVGVSGDSLVGYCFKCGILVRTNGVTRGWAESGKGVARGRGLEESGGMVIVP